jgi:hypothetical protein
VTFGTVSDAKLDASAGTNVDTFTWRITSAADGATCELYLNEYSSGHYAGNVTFRVLYVVGKTTKWTLGLAPDIHDGYATYTMACWIGAETPENKRWATPGQINVE